MAWIVQHLNSSIWKKCIMGMTGLALCLFVTVHLIGNLLIFFGPRVFNAYGHHLETAWWIVPAEIGLVATFLIHFCLAIILTIENRRARSERYFLHEAKGNRTIASKTMIYTGSVILIFLIIHLINFKFGIQERDARDYRDFHGGVSAFLSQPLPAIGYILAVCILGLHVSHGLHSAFRSLGFNHPKYTPAIERASYAFGFIVAAGYSSIPLWALLTQGGAQ